MNEQQKFILDNSVRVLVEPIPSVKSASIGVWCRTGSACENADEAGITHLIEHMVFKGTEKRTALEIAQAIEGRGGHMNAYTDKEATCYYASVLSDDAANAIDVLVDMVVNHRFNQEELKREESVVVEEIRRSTDEPSSHVHELHMSNIWGDHPLGLPIIGTEESVSGFDTTALDSYMARTYVGRNLMLSVAGNVDVESILAQAKELFGHVPAGVANPPLTAPPALSKFDFIEKDCEQVHFCMGTPSMSFYDERYHVASVLDSILGGGMSSRLFQEVRENRGLAYAIGSYNLPYSSSGLFNVYGGTSLSTWEEMQEVVRNELIKMAKEGVPEDELNRNKQYLCGNFALSMESTSAKMMRMSRNELNYERFVPMQERIDKINSVTRTQIQDLAQELFLGQPLSVTAIGPTHD